MRRNRRSRMGAPHGARERAHRRRPDLAAVRRRRRRRARRSPRCRASSGSRSMRRCARPSARPSSTIPCIALFPYTDPSLRDENGSEALNPDNLVCRAIRAIKKEVPDVGVLCDVALDPYTSHGHDGLMRDGAILNDETVAVLVKQALVQARGRLRHHRALRHDGRPRRRDPRRRSTPRAITDVQIMAYAAKYASAFYGPFRDAVGSSADADRRQAHLPDGLRQFRRGAARGRARHRRRRRHGHGQARPALSRHRRAA